jgi:hypothetical protein
MIDLLVYLILVAWLLISFFISVQYWTLFGVFAALAPGVLVTLVLLQEESFIVGSFYDPTAQTIVYQTMPIGYLIWIPIMLLILNVAYPIVKHLK